MADLWPENSSLPWAGEDTIMADLSPENSSLPWAGEDSPHQGRLHCPLEI